MRFDGGARPGEGYAGITVVVCGGDEALWAAARRCLEPRGDAVFLVPDPGRLPRFMSYFLPDMVILDFDSPRGGGALALRWVRSSRSGMLLPVLIASSRPSECGACWLPGDGLTKLVSKPVEEGRFRQAIDEFFDSGAVGRGGAILGGVDNPAI